MAFVIRFSVLALLTAAALLAARESWARYNTWLMAVFLAAAGLIFIP